MSADRLCRSEKLPSCRCQFLEEKHNKAISKDTWVQLLDFVRVGPQFCACCMSIKGVEGALPVPAFLVPLRQPCSEQDHPLYCIDNITQQALQVSGHSSVCRLSSQTCQTLRRAAARGRICLMTLWTGCGTGTSWIPPDYLQPIGSHAWSAAII